MVLKQEKTGNSFVSTGNFFILILFSMILMSNAASAATVTYYLSATSGVDIGADGVTNDASGTTDQNIPPIITAILDTTGANTGVARSANHPTGLYTHSRWYFTTNYPQPTLISANPSGRAYLRGGSTSDDVYVRLYDYDPSIGTKTLIGSSSVIHITSSTNTVAYPYTITSSAYIVPQGHRLMLQYDYSQTSSTSNARVYASQTNAYLTVVETPQGAGTTYNLSGYVTNASNSAAISGATVSVNSTPTQTTSTNVTGYYNFSLINGTYLITASSTNYNANSITRIVNGAPVPNADISLTPAPAGTGGKILVASNRYVVLDDPKTGSFSGTGFKNPTNSWTTDSITGVETTITMWAMLIDSNGLPVANRNVNFTLKNPVGTNDYTFTKSTDNNGLVNVTRDLNNKNYYGNWQIIADSDGLSQSTSFIYNWWGCGGGAGCSGHGSESWATGAAINSPYFTGHDGVVGAKSNHQGSNNCMYCHLSYNGQGSTAGMNTADRHSSFTCTDANCHGSISSHNNNMVIGSCNNCHTRGNITKKSTLNGILSTYSTTSTYHDQNSTIPCIICHGPMHNITKPDPTVGGLNDITEDTHCTTCHTNYQKHNGGVGCTLCHSQDIHTIKVFSQSGGYVNKGSANQGNCTNCHQNASFLTALKSAPKAGSYTGSAPQVQTPLNHSTDSAGTKWGTYWTTTKDACVYCHGDNKHVATRLGNAAAAVGTDTIGGAIGSGTVCASCHNSTDNDYAAMMALLSPDPVGFKSTGQNWNTSGTDHASYGTTDTDCKSCHGGVLSGSADISEFVHNVDTGKSGGPDCISCHDLSGTAPKKVDVTVLQSSSHNNLNGASTGINKACYACHGDGNAPSSGHPVNYKNPKTCANCHTGTGLYSAPTVIEHNQVGQDVITSSANCNSCHNNSGMFLPNSGTNGMTTAFMHYLKDVTNKGTSPYGHSGPIDTSDCVNCHNGPNTSNPDWGSPVNISTSTKRAHTETTTAQCDVCHNDGNVASLANVDFHNASIKLADATDCISCHISATGPGGIYNAINTASFTQHKNVNNTDGGLTNSDCMTCHTDITNMMTTGFTTTTKVCSDCHTGTGVPNAVIIDNHRQNGVNITTGASCATCHNNSINSTFAYSDNATVGHYATRTNLIATQDCTNCHKNSVNGTKWGNALDPAGSPSFPHSISNTPTGECYTCHNSAINFHNKTLVKPLVSTVTCLDCHKTTATMAPKKIDATVFGTGVHKNRACTDCHANATDVNMNNYQFSNDPAKTCTYCHVNSSNLAAPQIAEHSQVGQDANTTDATCNTCHDNSGMYLSNSGTNGTTSAITHYLKDVTNRSTTPYQHFGPINTSNCIDCHNGPNTSNPNWGNATNISTSTIRPHTETLTSQCDTCHNDGTVSTLANVDFHNKSIKRAPADDCIGCHQNAVGIYAAINTASFTKHENVNTTGGNNVTTNDDCKTCHTDITNMYNPGWTTPTKVCSDCHTGSGQYGAKVIDNHRQNGVNISTGVSCAVCHNNSVNSSFAYSDNATVSHYTTKTNLIATQDCTYCHKNPANATTWGNALDPAGSPTFPHSISNTPTGECYTCHNSAINFHNKTLVKPLVSTVTCLDCHKTTATMAPKEIDVTVFGTGVHKNRACTDCHTNATDVNMNTYSFASDPAKTCTYCHITPGNFSAPLVAEHNQVGQDVVTANANCNSCHDNSGMYLTNGGTNGTTSAITHYLKDVTNTSTDPYQHLGPLNTSNCIDCHNGPNTSNPMWGNPVNITTAIRPHTETETGQCDLCHNDGSVSTLAKVDFHNAALQMPSGGSCTGCHGSVGASLGLHSNLSGTPAVEDSDCQTCHFASFTMVTGAANSSNTYYCQACHTSGGTGPVKPTNPSLIKDGLYHGSTDCKWCHAAGDQPELQVPFEVDPEAKRLATGQNCVTCHYNSNLSALPFRAPGEIHSQGDCSVVP